MLFSFSAYLGAFSANSYLNREGRDLGPQRRNKGWAGLARKVLESHLATKYFPSQRRKGAKKTLRNAVALCAFAPLRGISFLHKATFRAKQVGLKTNEQICGMKRCRCGYVGPSQPSVWGREIPKTESHVGAEKRSTLYLLSYPDVN